MFCKKCGKELSKGAKFCPACGEKVVMPAQPSKDMSKNITQGKKAVPVIKLDNGFKTGKCFKKRKGVLFAGIAAVLAVTLLGTVAFSKLSGGSKKDDQGFDKKLYEDMPFTRSQVRGLADIYKTSYEDEKEGINIYIAGYMKYYNEYGDVHEMFQSLEGITEDLYQTMNEWDPNLKDVIAADAGERFGGDSYLGSYVVSSGVGAVLSDTEFGSEIRNTMENLVLSGMEYLYISSLEEKKENAVQSDAMIPVSVAGDYAVVRSHGTIGDMLYELKNMSGYSMSVGAIDDRLEDLDEENPLEIEDYWTDDEEELFETYKIYENYHGRMDALEERKQEWQDALYKWTDDFLVRVGVEDRDSAIEDLLWTDAQKEEKALLEYFDISNKKFEKLKEKYETDDIRVIIQETKGEDALEKYDEGKMEEDSRENEESIKGKYVYSIIDKEGKVYSSFLVANSGLIVTINGEGMCSVWAESIANVGEDVSFGTCALSDDHVAHIIMDKEGNTIFRNDTEDEKGDLYYDVTPSANVLKKSFETDAGCGEDNQILELVRPDGTCEKLMEGKKILLGKQGMNWYDVDGYCTDYYEYSCENHDGTKTGGIIDVSTGKLLTGDEFEEIEKEKSGVGNEFKITEKEKWRGVFLLRLNENYVLKNNMICDNFGKELKDLSKSGGVDDILYTGGMYWVITKDGWYYVLDDNFKEILKPVRLSGKGNPVLTEYGLLVIETIADETGEAADREMVVLYNEKGEKEEILESKNGNLGFENFLCYCGDSLVVNLHTGEPLLLSTPEKPTIIQ